ncbi:uncharacterized protein LOC122513568 isoform X5 [Polistes fuscatus]|uniref:uncharacterized protein LOC122513568 isoform X5 n=1 Tax=Polistes fuscatus TaxID=30207 RepID=UPI001CA9621D|nr:uncharacterized protein LOC122513568 isoform X5 [Polistes fuscatus]
MPYAFLTFSYDIVIGEKLVKSRYSLSLVDGYISRVDSLEVRKSTGNQSQAFLRDGGGEGLDECSPGYRFPMLPVEEAQRPIPEKAQNYGKERGIAKLLEFNSYLLLDVKNSALTYRINEELLVGYIYDRTKCYRVKGSQEGILTLTIGDLCYRLKG